MAPEENNFNFNVKLDAMKWKRFTQWKAGKARKAGKVENKVFTTRSLHSLEAQGARRRKFFLLPLSRRQEESFAALRAS
jgi:hypothetical protein